MSPIYLNKNVNIGWKSSKYLLIKQFESCTLNNEPTRMIFFINEIGKEIQEQYAFIKSLINSDVLRIVEDDIEQAKILLSY